MDFDLGHLFLALANVITLYYAGYLKWGKPRTKVRDKSPSLSFAKEKEVFRRPAGTTEPKRERRAKIDLSPEIITLSDEAFPLVKKMERVENRTGLNKFNYVYKELEKTHPGISGHTLTMAIELAYSRL